MTKQDTKNHSLVKSLFPKQATLKSLFSKIANPMLTTLHELLLDPLFHKSGYPINKLADKRLKNVD